MDENMFETNTETPIAHDEYVIRVRQPLYGVVLDFIFEQPLTRVQIMGFQMAIACAHRKMCACHITDAVANMICDLFCVTQRVHVGVDNPREHRTVDFTMTI